MDKPVEPEKTTEEKVDSIIQSMEKALKLDTSNPLEQALKYKTVKQNLPDPGFMEVRVHEETDSNGSPVVISESTNENGTIKKMTHNPFFVVDLNKLLFADITACPSSVGPMITDMAQRLVELKKNAFKPEKPVKEFNWWWIVFIILLLPGILLGIFMLVNMFSGGGGEQAQPAVEAIISPFLFFR